MLPRTRKVLTIESTNVFVKRQMYSQLFCIKTPNCIIFIDNCTYA